MNLNDLSVNEVLAMEADEAFWERSIRTYLDQLGFKSQFIIGLYREHNPMDFQAMAALFLRHRFYLLLQAGQVEQALRQVPEDVRPELAALQLAHYDFVENRRRFKERIEGQSEVYRTMARARGWPKEPNRIQVLKDAASLDYRLVVEYSYYIGDYLGSDDYIEPWSHCRDLGFAWAYLRYGHDSRNAKAAAPILAGYTGDPFLRQWVKDQNLFKKQSYVIGALKAGVIDRALEFPGLDLLYPAIKANSPRYLKTIPARKPREVSDSHTVGHVLAQVPFNPDLFRQVARLYDDASYMYGVFLRLSQEPPQWWHLPNQLKHRARESYQSFLLRLTRADEKIFLIKMAIHYERLHVISKIPSGGRYNLFAITIDLIQKDSAFIKQALKELERLFSRDDLQVIMRRMARKTAGNRPELFEWLADQLAQMPNPRHKSRDVPPVHLESFQRPGEPHQDYWLVDRRRLSNARLDLVTAGNPFGPKYKTSETDFQPEDFGPELAKAMKHQSQRNIDFIRKHLPYRVNSSIRRTALEQGYPEIAAQYYD